MTTRPNRRRASPWGWYFVALIVLLLDQATKMLVLKTFQPGASVRITDFFNLVLVFNDGAAFSLLAQASGWQRWLFIGIGAVAALVIIVMLFKHAGERVFALALSLILGGAVGNVVDRILYGRVVDFLDFHWNQAHFPAFNVADCGITVGAGLLILDEVLRVRRGKR